MDKEFVIQTEKQTDGPLVQVGPVFPGLLHQIQIPSWSTATVDYGKEMPSVTLHIVFSGERVEISKLEVSADTGFVTTQFLTQLALPKVLRQFVVESVPNSSTWTLERGEEGMGVDSYDFLAQLYWFEHLSWGSPRGTIMKFMGWSRANTNWHLRKIEKEFALPGRANSTRELERKPGSRN